MSIRLPAPRRPGPRRRPLLGGWFLLVLFLQASCARSTSHGGMGVSSPHPSPMPPPAPGAHESATEYAADFLEPGAVSPRPVPIPKAEFQQAFQRLARDVRWGRGTPREAAHALLKVLEEDWLAESYRGRVLTLVPVDERSALTPEADEVLKEKYLRWCGSRGGGDCLGLLDDGPYLRTDDRRTLALALAFGSVLDETRDALTAELLDVKKMVSLVVWTVALYCMMWVVPEPTTKAIAATLTVILMGYLGLQTVYGLMDGWARMADAAHQASTFEELRAAGEEFGEVLGKDAARAMILAVATLSGHTLGQVVARVKSLPRFDLAGAQFEAQGGGAVLGRLEATEAASASEGALAKAVAAVESVATSPRGPLAVVLLKKGTGSGTGQAPGGRSAEIVIRHRGGNRQVELSDGQRWHLPRGKSAADIPAKDKVGDMLQEAVTKAANEWGAHRLSTEEFAAIQRAEKQGEYWLARLLEREARGRFVHARLKAQFDGPFRFKHQGVDVIDPTTGHQYEILAGTDSNLARHGRRMASEFFRMLTF